MMSNYNVLGNSNNFVKRYKNLYQNKRNETNANVANSESLTFKDNITVITEGISKVKGFMTKILFDFLVIVRTG